MTATRDITTNRGDGADKLAGGEAGDGFIGPRCGELADGKVADLPGGGGQGVAQSRADCFPGGGHFFRSDAQVGRVVEAVELGRVFEDGVVAALAHIGNDATDDREHGVKRCAAAALESGEDVCRLLRAAPLGSD